MLREGPWYPRFSSSGAVQKRFAITTLQGCKAHSPPSVMLEKQLNITIAKATRGVVQQHGSCFVSIRHRMILFPSAAGASISAAGAPLLYHFLSF
jgi:hypothetical protein